MTVTIQELPADTVKLITSTQIVTSVATAVKELLENSIDAGSKTIQIRLENYGLDLIEVKDDGCGVSYDNVQKMFLSGYTSKIREFKDLDNLYSYGFRGEALSAMCKIANLSLTTKTKLDSLAMTYEIDSNGVPLSSKPSHITNGTIISVSNLFSNLPVRRLFLSAKKKITEELKKTEQIVQCLSLIHPELSVLLIHNKCPIWKKNSLKGIKQSFMQVAGLKAVSKMEHIFKSYNEINLDLIIPKKNLENFDNVFSNSVSSLYVYVNKRPVNCKILSQVVQEHIFHHYINSSISSKYAVCLISVQLPPQQLDINLEPNKTKILLKNQIPIIKFMDEILKNYYGHSNFTCSCLSEIGNDYIEEKEEKQPSKRQKLEDEIKMNEFEKKNPDWDVDIIDEDCEFIPCTNEDKPNSSCFPQSLCSQINISNCVLTTEEVFDLNSILNKTNHKLLISTNSSNCETRLIERNDIQSRVGEKPILKEWPSRPKVVVNTQPSQLNESKTVEKIAEEIRQSAEEWSSKMMKNVESEQSEKKVLEEDVNQFNLSMQSVSSQMGKKELKAFTKFARIMRPKICEEFPNIKFTQVAGILAERWKALTPDEVKYYERMADVVDLNRKIHQETKIPEKPKPTIKVDKSPNLKSFLEKLKKKKIPRPTRREVLCSVSIERVRELIPKSDTENQVDVSVVGQLQLTGDWLYVKWNEIGHIRHQGLQELIVSQKMLNNFSLPRKTLGTPIPVNEEVLGSNLWSVLTSLESEWDDNLNKNLITSFVIVKNGFLIEIIKAGERITSGNIIEATDCFGVEELKDVLALYERKGECGGLASWRSTTIWEYIMKEAIKITQQSTQPPTREELEEMINTYNLCFQHLPPLCLHSKEIFPIISTLRHPTTDATQ